jgi:DnaJ homolog subfamily C member 19
MIAVLLGLFVLALFVGGLNAFSRASVTTIKSLLAWIAALAGLSLTLLLVLTGRGPFALFALSLGLPLAREWWTSRVGRGRKRMGSRPSSRTGPGAMSEAEAWEVLGLTPGATEEEIRAAHHRLMRGTHPDTGGSDWLAARVNQARDILLRSGRTSR